MDEDVTHFLDMLDAATERVFEAYTGKMAADSCTVAVPQSEQIVQSSPNLQQGKEFSSQLSFRNTPPFQSELSSAFYEPQNRRKRCRTSEEPGFPNLVSNQVNIGLTDKNLLLNSNNHFGSWPQNFTFQSSGVNKFVGGFESKQSSFLFKNHHQQPKKLPSRIQGNLINTGVSDFDGSNTEGEKKEVEKPADISKEIEEAINRIESLIPSLQKLVNSAHSPKQSSVHPKFLTPVNSSRKQKDWVITGNETGHMENLPAVGEIMGDKQASPMLTDHNLPVPSQVKWSRNVNRVEDDASNGKVGSDDQASEETSWSTCASSSATTQQSGSTYSSSGTYESSESEAYDGDESEPRHETVGQSTRKKQAQVVTDSGASAYDDTTTSSYNSRDEYSDVGPSSQMSSAKSNKWNLQKKERGKGRGGRLRRLGRKLGMIFHHHHHHHHHHYSDKDEHDALHARSIWTRLGEMFQHTKNDGDHHKETKVKKPRRSELKALVKRKKQGGHFHALVDGLMKHMKHSKKPKQVKNSTKELRNARHGGKHLPWWPKIHKGRGGIKVSNKRKVKLGNYRTKSMAAAKIVLGK